ncbi:MAG TPA: tetratricopeptide repeat protein [Opitutaceae bacterium]|nr:tetratricopeptide repeat protein [Opitutaceae bacterium]
MPVGTSTDSRRWSSRAKTAVAAALITVAALAAYANTFHAPFVFDDGAAILRNSGIRRLWPLWSAFWPQSPASAVDGRPVANFTLALNYALSGTNVWSYHALNLVIHILAGLALFGVVRRTLILVGSREQGAGSRAVDGDRRLETGGGRVSIGLRSPASSLPGANAAPLALAGALLWTLHPLQTEAVTYTVQRVESLMGLFYLLTLYCFIRGVEETTGPLTTDQETKGPRDQKIKGLSRTGVARSFGPLVWYSLSILCCLLGMATKEVMVTAPVLIFLYDRTFVAGTFREAWRRRGKVHLGLAATWLLLAALVASTGWTRGGAAGFGVGVKPWAYWLTQFEAVVRYLWLTVCPHPLVFDYGTFFYQSVAAVWWPALIVTGLLALTVVALVRRPAAGFLGAWFFGILAVTSVVPGTIQMIVEHRMYLPLAALVTAGVIGAHTLLRRPTLTLTFTLTLALALGLLTFHRNADYASELVLWTDTVAKRPDSPRARNGLAFALDHAGRTVEAIQQFEAALRLAPNDATLHDNLGVTLEAAGRTAEARQQYEAALRLDPKYALAHSNLGNALLRSGDRAAAIGQFEEALRLRPDYPEAHYNLGGALDQSGRTTEAVPHLEAAVRLKPDFAEAHYNLGDLLDRLGRPSEAMAHYEAALRIEPNLAQAHDNLGVLLCRTGRAAEGLAHLAEAVRLQPEAVLAHFNYGVALMQAGRTPEAIQQYAETVRLQPDLVTAHVNLGMALGQSGRLAEAIAELRRALRLSPESVEAHYNLGSALLQAGRVEEAAAEYEEVLRLRPDYAPARRMLDQIRAGLPPGSRAR